jgi:hypothetical protein
MRDFRKKPCLACAKLRSRRIHCTQKVHCLNFPPNYASSSNSVIDQPASKHLRCSDIYHFSQKKLTILHLSQRSSNPPKLFQAPRRFVIATVMKVAALSLWAEFREHFEHFVPPDNEILEGKWRNVPSEVSGEFALWVAECLRLEYRT